MERVYFTVFFLLIINFAKSQNDTTIISFEVYQQLEGLNQTINTLSQNLEECKSQNNDIEKDIDKKHKGLIREKRRFERKARRIDGIDDISDIEKELEGLKEKHKLILKNDSLKFLLKEKQKIIKTINDSINDLDSIIDQHEITNTELKTKDNTIVAALSNNRVKILKLIKTRDSLKRVGESKSTKINSLTKLLTERNNYINNNNKSKLQEEHQNIKEQFITDIKQKVENFVNDTVYDKPKSELLINQVKQFKEYYLKPRQPQYTEFQGLEESLMKFKKIIVAINRSKIILDTLYKRAEIETTVGLINRALELTDIDEQHRQQLDYQKDLLTNYCKKNNKIYQTLKAADDFYNSGMNENATRIINEELEELNKNDYPFLYRNLENKLYNEEYRFQIAIHSCN